MEASYLGDNDFEAAKESMRKHPVPGSTLREWVIPAKGYSAFPMKTGQVLRVVDIEGKQVPDVVCFNAHDLGEEICLANSQLLNKQQELRKGAVIFSQLCSPMISIVDYSNELCFTYGSMCSEELNRHRYGIAGTENCRDNFAKALESWGINRRDIPNAFVPFMNVVVEPDGRMEIEEPTSVSGDFYDMKAEMDLLVAISNCPQSRNPCNGWNPTATGVTIYAPE